MDSFAASLSSESALSLQSLFRVLPAVYQELELLLSHLKAIAEPVQEDLTLTKQQAESRKRLTGPTSHVAKLLSDAHVNEHGHSSEELTSAVRTVYGCHKFITMLVCRQVHASLFAGQEAYPRLHKKKWRISDEVLTCLLKMTLRMMDYIDTQTQRIGLCLLRNLAAVTTDTSLQWHSPSILWTIKRALRGRDLQVFRVLLPLSVSLLQRLESPPGRSHHEVFHGLFRDLQLTAGSSSSMSPELRRLYFREGLTPLIDRMGLEICQHLPHLLPFLLDAATAGTCVQTVIAASEALVACIKRCWPRMRHHRHELLVVVAHVFARHLLTERFLATKRAPSGGSGKNDVDQSLFGATVPTRAELVELRQVWEQLSACVGALFANVSPRFHFSEQSSLSIHQRGPTRDSKFAQHEERNVTSRPNKDENSSTSDRSAQSGLRELEECLQHVRSKLDSTANDVAAFDRLWNPCFTALGLQSHNQ